MRGEIGISVRTYVLRLAAVLSSCVAEARKSLSAGRLRTAPGQSVLPVRAGEGMMGAEGSDSENLFFPGIGRWSKKN